MDRPAIGKSRLRHSSSDASAAEQADFIPASRPSRSAMVVESSAPHRAFDDASLHRLKQAALTKGAELNDAAAAACAGSIQAARLLAGSDLQQAGHNGWLLLARLAGSSALLFIARALVCAYFVSCVYDQLASWRFMQQEEVRQRADRWPQHYPVARFPYFGLSLLLPCALLAAMGVHVLWTAGLLALWEVCDSAQLVWRDLSMLVLYGHRPNELLVKRLAMLGSVTLVLAHGAKQQRSRINGYAGLLLEDSPSRGSRPRASKSAALMLGRLLMAWLFVYVGITQMQRVISRNYVLWSHTPHSKLWERDGHDNCWLLLQFVLALPLAAGFKTGMVSRLLDLTLVMEAVTCWPFWAQWPTLSYASHVRLHFVTNLGVAGGLLLLASQGAGRFTVDALLEKKRQ